MIPLSAKSPITFAKEAINWCIILSVLMILAGVLAIAVPPVAGIAVTLFVGWLLIFSGAAHLVFGWHTRTAGGLLWEFLVALLYILVGGYLLTHVQAGLATLTLALAVYLFLESILELVLGVTLRPMPGSRWLLFDGVITLILAILIWRSWPSSALSVIGTLVGISLLFSGVSRLTLSMGARRLVAKVA